MSNTLIFALQHWDSAINLKKSVLKPTQRKIVLDLSIETVKMTLDLAKISKIISQFQITCSQSQEIILALSKLLAICFSTSELGLHARL